MFNILQLNKHKRHECVERRCPCSDCGALFPSRARLRNHRVSVHPHRPPVVDDINAFQCCKCDRGFETEEELLKHQGGLTSNLICDVKSQGKKRGRKPKYAEHRGVDIKKIKQEEDATGGEGYDDYPKDGSPSEKLQSQLKIPCPEADCDLIFPSVAALRAHKKEKHGLPSRKTNACAECDKSYARPEQLKAHMTKAHLLSFAQENVLKVHQSTHTEGEHVTEKR